MDFFFIFNGVNEGCVFVMILFSMLFLDMFIDIFRNCDVGIKIWCRFEGKLFNFRC